MWKRGKGERGTETNRMEEDDDDDDDDEVFAVIIDSVSLSACLLACELSNCSPPIFDFRHHFWLCNRHHPRARSRQTSSSSSFSRNQISNQKAFSSLTYSLNPTLSKKPSFRHGH